ncbi:hypothetical protein F4809DRAFT_639721 [Biscogniauxia mediterranea]|nr:hypothetical protein F4809DRAFT_639721 [Biscogniauxia mediterranea]
MSTTAPELSPTAQPALSGLPEIPSRAPRGANYNIDWSCLPNPNQSCVFEKVSISGGRYIIAGVSLAIGIKDKPVHIHFGDDYNRMLSVIGQWHFIFYDLHFNESNRSLRLYEKSRERWSEITTWAEDGKSEEVIKEKVICVCVEDRVEQVCNVLAQMIAHQDGKPPGTWAARKPERQRAQRGGRRAKPYPLKGGRSDQGLLAYPDFGSSNFIQSTVEEPQSVRRERYAGGEPAPPEWHAPPHLNLAMRALTTLRPFCEAGLMRLPGTFPLAPPPQMSGMWDLKMPKRRLTSTEVSRPAVCDSRTDMPNRETESLCRAPTTTPGPSGGSTGPGISCPRELGEVYFTSGKSSADDTRTLRLDVLARDRQSLGLILETCIVILALGPKALASLARYWLPLELRIVNEAVVSLQTHMTAMYEEQKRAFATRHKNSDFNLMALLVCASQEAATAGSRESTIGMQEDMSNR